MEASESPQLPLDGGSGDGAAVRVLDDRLVIERLTVADERAARVVRERVETGQLPAETVGKAIEIGARVLDSEETAANVDYVRAEFERHAAALRERLGKTLESGEQQLAERIAESFDSGRDGSVQNEIDRLLSDALAEQRTALLRLFSAEEGANPLHDFKGAMIRAFKALDSRQQAEGRENRERIDELTQQVVELRQREEADRRVAEAEEAGTRKGRTFEERVHLALERLADGRGDVAQRVGDARGDAGGKKGDVLVEIDAAGGPCAGRIVFEVKDKRLSRNDAWAELNGALDQRGAGFAVMVVAGEERLPARTEQLHEYEGNKLLIAVDRDDPDDLGLEIAYRYARCRVLMARDRELTVDAAGVRDAAEEAVSALKRAQSVRLALTGATDSVDRARSGLDELVAEVHERLARIESLVAEAGAE